jgi:hypothetical protein
MDLAWDAPPGCPTERDVRTDVAAMVGALSSDLRAHARVERGGDATWELTLVMWIDGHEHRRVIRAASCEEVAAAGATILALASRRDPAAEPARPSLASEAPLAWASADAVERPSRSSAVTESLRAFAVGSALAGSIGASGEPSGAVGGVAAWLPGRMRVEVGVLSFFPSHVERPALGISGDFRLLVASVAGCYAVLHGPLSIAPCVGGELGQIGAVGGGLAVAVPIDRSERWSAARGGGLLVLRFGSVALRVGLDAVVPLVRNRFVVEGVGEVYRPAPLSGRLVVGGELHFH